MADPTAPKSPASVVPTADQRKAAYEFCEKAHRDFEALLPSQHPKGFFITRSQTISGDTVQRTFVLQFELKLTGCELAE
jgi:hypothetical protein